eukprot:TRINITY_DN24_c0_g1_i1.p1 TRINITY_DN24_c0_g1~~TRINITY_DN24_c0_g1_i1.p1  ORF type:complete len:1333 (+),score=408.90 TRINITY_DN24_c0_g1_i1:378-4001(+)
MDGSDGACPSLTDLVGNDGLWAADLVHSFSGGSDWLSRLGGCSWMPRAAKKLSFNRGNLTNAQFPHAQNTVQASPLDDWLICSCPEGGYPKYVSVVAGQTCPDHERESFLGQQPTCAPLTAEGNCEEAAAMMGLPDQSLEMCIANCSDANVSAHETDAAVNTAEVGPHRPPGCHYRFHPDIADDHLWFNPHGDSSTAYAKPPGEGVAPDYLICGCGDVAPLLAMGGCQFVGNTGKSRSCGHGQTCQALPTGGFRCTCDYPIGSPATAENEPAQCTESVPKKIISWVSGSECPYDEDTQCLPPPTKERCEEAARALGLADPDMKASLPHSADDLASPHGCHFNVGQPGERSPLRWNPNATGDVSASHNDSLICECRHYPMFVPKLAGAGCGSGPGSCKAVESRFECALAADAIGIPVPAGAQQAQWNTLMCVVDPQAGVGSPWVPCGSPGAADCTAEGADTRLCRFSDTQQMWVLLDPHGGPALDGCHYHAPSSSGSPLWWYNSSMGDAGLANSADTFRLCDCADESMHNVIAPRLGFAHVGRGDCSKGEAPGNTCVGQPNGQCVMKNGTAVLRSARYNCSAMTTVAGCHADVDVCRWESGEEVCLWRNESFAFEAEIPAFFSDCLEHCMLLCHCTGVSFFTPANESQASIGGCDFFTGEIVDATGESKRVGKGQGEWDCWRNVPETTVPTPAPTWDCPQCNMIPGQFECRNTFGCAWSEADFCCCDPFVTACTHSWHTATNNQAACESTTDEGRQCKWIVSANDPGAGICELPLAQCVDEYADFVIAGSLPANFNATEACSQLVLGLKAQFTGIARGCGSCNFTDSTESGSPVVLVQLAVDLVGDKSCGQSTRIAARHSQVASTLSGSPLPGLGLPLVSHDIRSRCWDECQKNPLCPKGPTAAPTPIGTSPPAPSIITLPPNTLQTGFNTSEPTVSPVAPATPTKAPTASPDLCPVKFSTSSPQAPFECECEKFECPDSIPMTKPFKNSQYQYCDRCDPRMDGAFHFTCPHCAPGELQINITCPNHYEACDLFVWTYNEPGCSKNDTHSVNGGWVDSLPGEWTASSCLPKFCGNSSCDEPKQFPTVAFHKQILPGETEELPETATNPTMFSAFVVNQGKVCGNHGTQSECEDGIGLCSWINNECRLFLCPAPPPPAIPPPGVDPPLPPPGTYPTPRLPGPQPPNHPDDRVYCCMRGAPGGECSLADL